MVYLNMTSCINEASYINNTSYNTPSACNIEVSCNPQQKYLTIPEGDKFVEYGKCQELTGIAEFLFSFGEGNFSNWKFPSITTVPFKIRNKKTGEIINCSASLFPVIKKMGLPYKTIDSGNEYWNQDYVLSVNISISGPNEIIQGTVVSKHVVGRKEVLNGNKRTNMESSIINK